jgi:hypothetical protein
MFIDITYEFSSERGSHSFLSDRLLVTLSSLFRRRWPGDLGYVLVGGYLLYRGLTGYCPAFKAMGISTVSPTKRRQIRAGDKAKYRPGYEEQPTQADLEKSPASTIEITDKTDESLWETFPASDPPASW